MKRRKWIILAALTGVVVLCIGFGFHSQHPGWRVTGSLNHPRSAPAVTVLLDGRVLVTGGTTIGIGEEAFSSCEIYDPVTVQWTDIPPMNQPRFGHSANLLPDGRVLICGGVARDWDNSSVPVAGTSDCEIYDPVRNLWSNAPSMSRARFDHFSFPLPNGNIMVAGGLAPEHASTLFYRATATTEIYDSKLNSWRAGPDMVDAQAQSAVCTLANGTVAVLGGMSSFSRTSLTSSVGTIADGEIYDPNANRWSRPSWLTNTFVTGMAPPVFDRLPNGSLFCFGGNFMTIVDSVHGIMKQGQVDHLSCCVQLPNGKILGVRYDEVQSWLYRKMTDYGLEGYLPYSMQATPGGVCELFDDKTLRWKSEPFAPKYATNDPILVLLKNNQILLIGAYEGGICEIADVKDF